MSDTTLRGRVARMCLAAVFAGTTVGAAAEVYRWKDAHGNVIFSDTPHEGAKQIELKQTTIVPALKPPAADAQAATPDKVALAYEGIAIAAPPNDATLRGQQEIAVDVMLEPALQADQRHTIQLFVDGAPHGEPLASNHFILENIDRGSHQLAAAVLDQNGKELLRSPVSVFHLHKTTVGDLPPPKPPPK